jgi:hypothetical protein
MGNFRQKIVLSALLALSVNCHALAESKKDEKEALAILSSAQAKTAPETPAVAPAVSEKAAKAEKDAKAAMSAALFELIEKTQGSMNDSLSAVRSDLATDLEIKTRQFLAEPDVYTGLLNMAYQRKKMDSEPKEDSFYVAEALSSLNGSLRLTPGVMGDDALINRAKLLAEIAGYYSLHDKQMCRYIPSDFSILMSIDAPWLVKVDAQVFHQAMDDEYAAIKLMLNGVLPRNVNDSDKQMVVGKFASKWLASLAPDDLYRIAAAKKEGNYCELWASMLSDMEKMADSFPDTSKKVIAPFMLSMSRGWMDSGLWSYEAPAAEVDEQ